MDIIVRGEPHELDFVRRICRDKVARGVLAILPGTGPASDEVVRLRKERDETKAVITTLQERVAALETAAEPEVNAPESNEPEQMDDKYIEVEDMQEVDLDTDDKTPAADDTKDVQTDDVKETAPAKKTSKRSKKSE